MGILRRQAEEAEREAKKKTQKDKREEPKKREKANYIPAIALGLIFFGLLFFMVFRFPGSSPVGLSLDAQATDLANQQEAFRRNSERATQQYIDQQAQIQRQQDNFSTQIAIATSTEAANGTATAFAYIQTPMAATQMALAVEVDKKKQELEANQQLIKTRMYFYTFLFIVISILIVVGMVIVFKRYLPVWLTAQEVKARTVTEEKDESKIFVGDKSIVKPDLMLHPNLNVDEDGQATGSGGASDQRIQSRIAQDAAYVKGIRALQPGSKLPGQVPQTETKVPELEFIDAEIIDPKLLKDIHEALDSEA